MRVHAGGEVHDVEVALNKVQDSAVSSRSSRRRLRRNIADAYVNLGRRNQNLLSRQLEFITQLENDESDPETLEHLFRLDHLATRMRRNAESLLVLAGLAPPRTWSAPVAMGDVVRGALGEVEGYRRVRLRHVDDARVDGAAAADVSHVIAELVENALSFSPPDADVEVYGRRDDHGYVITIVDSGIGMHDEELERANSLISSANALTLAPSRFLGHYVVAQLAARHGLTVHLAASPAGGLTAMVALPGRTARRDELAARRPAAEASRFAPHDRPTLNAPPDGLPRRESAPSAPAAPIAFRAAAGTRRPCRPSCRRSAVHEVDLDASFDDIDNIDKVERDRCVRRRRFVRRDPHRGASRRRPRPRLRRLPNPHPHPHLSPRPSPSRRPRRVPSRRPNPRSRRRPPNRCPPRPRSGLGTFADLRGAIVADTGRPAGPNADPDPVSASSPGRGARRRSPTPTGRR